MSLAVSFHDLIENYNVLKAPTDQIKGYFREDPDLHKIALLVNHVFRAISMMGMGLVLPFYTPINLAICFAGSLFYRLTVETNCAYKFALPAFAGSVAIPLAISGLTKLVTLAAFASLSAFVGSLALFVPISAYVTYIVLTVNYDLDRR